MVGNEVDGPFFWCMPWEMWPDVDLMHFTHQKKLCSPESQFEASNLPLATFLMT